MAEPTAAATMVELLQARAAAHGARAALSFLDRGERVGDQASYGELDRQARAVARCLVQAGLAGRPVLLGLASDLDFVRVFLGCLYAGAAPAPAPPLEGRRGLERNRAILADFRPAAIICAAAARDRWALEAGPGCLVITAAEALATAPGEPLAAPDPDALAFVQYTSGSLSRPRGAAVTHRNIMANQAMIQAAFGHDETLVGANWLPLHHDMGLIGSMLQTLFAGGSCVSMSPQAFLQQPMRWPRAIETFRATTSGGPNFAYDLLTRMARDEAIGALDLSSWRVAFCGAEPVRAPTLRAFAQRFAPAGFDAAAFLPCYGLAEATLLVASARGLSTRPFAGESVSCGRPATGSRLVVIGADDLPVRAGMTGEVCVAGEHVSPGFWSGEHGLIVADAEREVMHDARRYLRTGDLGALADGELHVLGRQRDLIIVRGTKVHAEDVEAACHAGSGAVLAAAAFAVDHEAGEHLVVVCETEDNPWGQPQGGLALELRSAVGAAHGLLPREVVLVRRGALPRSANGKIRRAECRDHYLAGRLSRMSRGPGRIADA